MSAAEKLPQEITLREWHEMKFGKRRPYRTTQYWAANGYIPGVVRRGRMYFVKVREAEKLTGNELVDQVLRDS